MPDPTFPAALIAVKNALRSADGWRWLVEIDADGSNGYRLNDGDQPITYGGDTFAPYPFLVEEITAESDGSLPQVGIVFASVDDHVATRLNAGHVLDRRIRLRRFNPAADSVTIDAGTWTALDAVVDMTSATLVLGPYPILDAPFPALRQIRQRCPKVYGGPDCGYDTSMSNLIAGTYPDFDPAGCDYGLDTGNGCRAHGANEAANGAAVRHPDRFGGFPGIPKGLRL